MKTYLFLTILVLFPLCTWGQDIPLGTWRTHFSYKSVSLLTESPNQIFAAADVGLFSVDKNDGTITRYSTLDGFQDVNISALAYNPEANILCIGYSSGNMDVVTDGEVVNVDLVSGSQVVGSKTINDFAFAGGYTYIATDYGILKFDPGAFEVRETYRELGENANQLGVRNIEFFTDSIYAATPEGVLSAPSTGIPLADYRNWTRKPALSGATELAVAYNRIIAISSGNLYRLEPSGWEAYEPLEGPYRAIRGTGESLIIVTPNTAYATNEAGLVTGEVTTGPMGNLRDALLDVNASWWMADGSFGLISDLDGSLLPFSPSGPAVAVPFRLNGGETITAPAGGYDSQGTPLGHIGEYSKFSNGQWEGFTVSGSDIVDVEVMKEREFLASWGDGLFVRRNGTEEVFNEDNSPLTSFGEAGDVRIAALEPDGDDLYLLNYGVAQPLLRIDSDDQWTSFPGIPGIGRYATDLKLAGEISWMPITASRGGGLLGYDVSENTSRYLTDQADQGGLAARTVHDLALDKDGFLWIGTARGVSILFNPFNLNGDVNAIEPVFDGRPLLVDRQVYSVTVDEGNRKWLGTDGGAWLFDDLADELIVNFTTENSPLPSNDVQDIAIDKRSGEVFFLTADGIVSFRGDATEDGDSGNDVAIFPNPVTRNFNGVVGIRGLEDDAVVKITDVSGRVVYETRANGGTATWPLRSMGKKVSSGMYLIFSATGEGDNTYVGKVAVIN